MSSSTFDLGFLGGGQLARMSIQAAQRMGLRCLSLDPGGNTPASQIAEAVHGALDDPAKIAEVLTRCDRVTLENEFIPADAIREAVRLSGRSEDVIVPGIGALATIQDKLLQRQALLVAGVPSPRAVPMDGGGRRAAEEIGFPMVLKARFGGYDGKGTRYARTPEELERHRPLWEAGGWLAEEFVPFRRELAVMVAVGRGQELALETVETIQTNHVCDFTFPSRLGEFGDADASATAIAAVRAVGGQGLFGVELFETADNRLLINELAPRPHNTGHYTLDWGAPSQFDIHVRLVMGLPLEASPGGPTYMANLLGQVGATDYRRGLRAALEADAAVRVHWYGKAESKPGRKMGHLNLAAGEAASATLPRLREIREAFYRAWTSP
jgi:5-(carboxyamino)imidazole ribonucleotide synthase